MTVTDHSSRQYGRRALLFGAGSVVAAASLAACAGDSEAAPLPNAVDIGFSRDMAFHHEQALAMCQRVLGADTGGAVQASAAEILQTQSYERGMMHAWLASWGHSTAPPETVMAWMGHAVPAEQMPGLATDEQMAELAAATGLEKGRQFLTLMRAHHVGGVEMADEAQRQASIEDVQALASRMSATQTFEINQFDYLLANDYA